MGNLHNEKTVMASAQPEIKREQLRGVLQKYWGYDSFLPLQEPAMHSALEHRDSVVVLPTGGGKSLCFQAPAIVMDGIAVVVSPLISLMKDQVDALRGNGVSAACTHSMVSSAERRQIADDIRAGAMKLLYVSPERLVQPKTIDFLKDQKVSLVAIDEAHCISAWGHDFRPEYRQLRILKEAFPGVGVHAYTATATPQVRSDIAQQLGLDNPQLLVGSFDRPNLIYKILRRDKRLTQIREVLDRHPGESGVIYCITRKDVDETSAALCQLGYKALPYHAGMENAHRQKNQDAFIQEKVDTIVATVAFGMGIDKSNVRYVVHAGMPKSLEHYQQESGRAGRDGLDAECCLIHSGQDFIQWRNLVENDETPHTARDGMLGALQAISNFCGGVICRHRALVEHFGQSFDRENCGACDVCLGELDLAENPLVIGQKILSCVVRLGQNFGASYTADVLVGSENERILQREHNTLSTWGILRDENKRSIRDWIEQLVDQQFLEKAGEYGVLQVTAGGRRLLKGDAAPRLLKAKAKEAKKAGRGVAADSWEGVDRGLFEQLRGLRRELAEAKGVPAYIVFGDATLRDMARGRPTTLTGMGHVRGIGEKKLNDYGEQFMVAIGDYCSQHGVATDVAPSSTKATRPAAKSTPQDGPTASATKAFPYFQQGASVEAVAANMNRALSTVHGYLTEFIQHEKIIDPSPWVERDVTSKIEQAVEEFGTERLKPIFESFGGAVSYEEIRIVVGCLENRD